MLRIYKLCKVLDNKHYQQSNTYLRGTLLFTCLRTYHQEKLIHLHIAQTHNYRIQLKNWYASQETSFAMKTKKVSQWRKVLVTLDASVSHSPPTPINAWIPWAILRAPRGPVLNDVWRISSTSLGKFSIRSDNSKYIQASA